MTPRFLCLVSLPILFQVGAASLARTGDSNDWDVERIGLFHDCGVECLRGHGESEYERLAGDDPRWNEGTGADQRNYAPSRPADFEHMKLEIDIPDMNDPRFAARQTLRLSPVGRPLEVIELQARQLEVQGVRLSDAVASGQTKVSFVHEGDQLLVRFDPPLEPGSVTELITEYRVNDPPDGLIWTPESDAWPDRAAQLHTQGQPETNSFWFPCHDSPNERLTTEVVVTVPRGFLVSSNGRLAGDPQTQGDRTTFHWLQDTDHVNYLVSLVVGKFDVVDVAPAGSKFPMPVYVPPGKAGDVQRTYGRTADMVRFFERILDEPYPWDRYAQLVVWNFGAGGMENTSCTTMYDTAVLDETSLLDGDLDGLISHELGHQWFGDMITCNTWAHLWLNEGWATYMTALWFGERDGFQDGYLNSMYGNVRGVAARDRLEPGDSAPHESMTSRVYESPNDVFRRRANPYPKGASVLHMLRMRLGDEDFFGGVARYVDTFKHRTVETNDFRRVLEEFSGQSLEHFFHQWCERPGTPDLHVQAKWDDSRKELLLIIEQKQRIDAEHPAFAFELPIYIALEDSSQDVLIPVTASRHERSISLASPPLIVAVDPYLSVLSTLKVDQPTDRIIAQLERGPSMPSRADAAAALGSKPGEKTVAALKSCLLNSQEHRRVRSAAAESLAKLDASDALVSAAESGIDDARVRVTVMESLSKVGGDAAIAILRKHATMDEPSYDTRAQALRGLGTLKHRESLPLMLAGLEMDSQHDDVRAGAIRGLAALDEPEGLEAVVPFTQLGHLNRLRPVAISALGDLAHHDKERAIEVLLPLLRDREERAVRAAAAALVKVEDDRGVEPLNTLATSSRHPDIRRDAERRASELKAAIAKPDSQRALRTKVEELEREIEQLRQVIEER